LTDYSGVVAREEMENNCPDQIFGCHKVVGNLFVGILALKDAKIGAKTAVLRNLKTKDKILILSI